MQRIRGLLLDDVSVQWKSGLLRLHLSHSIFDDVTVETTGRQHSDHLIIFAQFDHGHGLLVVSQDALDLFAVNIPAKYPDCRRMIPSPFGLYPVAQGN